MANRQGADEWGSVAALLILGGLGWWWWSSSSHQHATAAAVIPPVAAPAVPARDTVTAPTSMPTVSPPPPPPPAPPPHNYDFVEDDLYGYLGAVTDDDQKKGIATPPVVRFRYTGFWNGAHHIQNVNDNGAVTASYQCDVPCVAIKEIGYGGSLRRVGYTTRSIIGSAFEDAMSGRLRRSPRPGTIKDGYRFRGGDPGDAVNWQLIEQPSPRLPSVASAADTRNIENNTN